MGFWSGLSGITGGLGSLAGLLIDYPAQQRAAEERRRRQQAAIDRTDDERAGCVSPSHAAGGYAKWRRRTGAMRWGSNVSEDYSITINDGRYSVRPNQAFSRNR
jgi:hypothetical protein